MANTRNEVSVERTANTPNVAPPVDLNDNATIELDDMFGFYPTASTPGIQTLLTAKQEFNELASSVTEPIPSRGHYFKHQRLIERLMKVLPAMFLIHRTGTGKTCTFVAFSEWCKRARDTGDFNIRHVYVLVKGPALANEFRNQLVCRCTAGEYETDLVKNATNVANRKGNITREIRKFYSIMTYGEFASEVHSRGTDRRPGYELTDEEIVAQFSDCAFFVDEIQNIGLKQTTGEPGTDNQEAEGDIQHIYRQLWRVFHLAQRTRIVIASATPMVNGPGEIPYPMNLILPANQQMPTDGSVDYTNVTLEQLEPYFRGKISFVRELDTGAAPQFMGERIEAQYTIAGREVLSQMVVYATSMSNQVQGIGYANAENNPGRFREAERQAANFVFPDGTYGGRAPRMVKPPKRRRVAPTTGDVTVTGEIDPNNIADVLGDVADVETQDQNTDTMGDITTQSGIGPTGGLAEAQRKAMESGFGKWIVSDAPDSYQATPQLLPWISNLEYMRHLGCKYAETVRLCRDDPGNCYVYSEFVAGSGAIVEGLCFEAMGFERFNETRSVFISDANDPTGNNPDDEGTGGLPPLCGGSGKKNRRLRIPPRRRYALLTSETVLSEPKLNAILELFNSYENRHGDYLKVLIGSPISREGLSLSNCLQGHVSATWNESASYQAVSRILRATSHDDLIQEERQRLISQGQDPDLARVVVKLYRHAAVYSDPLTGEQRSIDLEMYQLSELKALQIARMIRIMKQCAVDCQIHYNRNVRGGDRNAGGAGANGEGDQDGTPICDYDVCAYQCSDPGPLDLDRTTYDLYYSESVVASVINDVMDLFRSRFTVTFDELYQVVGRQYRPKFVLMAIERMTTSKTMVYDRYGFQSYLQVDGNTVYLSRDFPVGKRNSDGGYALAYYGENLTANRPASLSTHVTRIQAGEQQTTVQELIQLDPLSAQFNQLLESLNVDNKATLLEDAVLRYTQGVATPVDIAVINKYQTVLYSLPEPINDLRQSANALANRGKGRGRKPNPGSRLRLKPGDLGDVTGDVATQDLTGQVDPNAETVYIHTLYQQLYDRVAYSVTSRRNKAEGRIRLLKPSEGIGWRDVNAFELPVYGATIQREIARKAEPFERFGIYGSVLHDSGFRIHDKAREQTELATKDARVAKRGKICITWLKNELVDLMWRLQLRPADYDFIDPNGQLTKEIMINYLTSKNVRQTPQELRQATDDWIRFHYAWARSGMTRDDICDYIQNAFAQNGRLMTS